MQRFLVRSDQVKKSMYKFFIAVCLFVVSFVSCTKENNEKETPETVKALMGDSENCVCEPYIDQYLWKGQTVYYLGYKGPLCNWFPAFYNDNGESIEMDPDYAVNHFKADSKLIKRIWTCGE